MSLNKPEPAPQPSEQPASWDLVIADVDQNVGHLKHMIRTPEMQRAVDLVLADMRERDASGAAKYGTRLQPHNGRDQLFDAYQEALDLAVYLRTSLAERHDGVISALYEESLTIVAWLRSEILRRSGR